MLPAGLVTRKKRQALAFRKVVRGHDEKVAMAERRDFSQVEALRQRDHAGVDCLEP
jgi:hypothetical protein